MQIFIRILIIISSSYGADLNVQIKPDTIYVGSLVTINISVTDLESDEYPVFYHVAEQPDMYSLIGRKLHEQSADYTLQFWKSGLITIPSFPVEIKRYKKNVARLQSDIIELSILSNIKNNNNSLNNALKDIKPMQEVSLISVFKVLLYTTLLIMGLLLAIYFWKCQKESQVQIDYKSDYNKTILQKTMRRLQSLQIPNNINRRNTEMYYLELSHIFRNYIAEEYFIRATEMTSCELEIYFQSLGIDHEILHDYFKLNQIADMAKYAGQIPEIDQFNKDKEDFINIIKSFHKIVPHLTH